MGGKAGNLIAEAFAAADGNFSHKTLVGLEVEGETRVVLFDKEASRLLDCFGTNATLTERSRLELVHEEGENERMDQAIVEED